MGYVMEGCNVQCSCFTECGRYGLSCLRTETVESMSSAESVWYVCMVCMVYGLYDVFESKLCCEILLNTVDMDQWKTRVSNAEYFVHLVRMNRLRAYGVHSGQIEWQDGIKVLCCHSHLVWLVFRVPSLHVLVFIQKICNLFLLFFFCIVV